MVARRVHEASAIDATAAAPAAAVGGLDQLLAALREHRALAALVIAYVAACYLLRLAFGYEVLAPINADTLNIWFTYTMIALGFPVAYHLIRFHWRFLRGRAGGDPTHAGEPGVASGPGEGDQAGDAAGGSLAEQWGAYGRRHFSAFRIAGVVVVCGLLSALMTTFLAYKRAIPLFQPFAWDLAFMRLDRAVHLGTHPWEILQLAFGSASATVVIDWIYVLWLRTIPLVIAWQAWNRDREVRSQFFLSYALSSILLGTLMATWLSSAGPCYYEAVVGPPDPYAGLFAFLGDVNASHGLRALRLQEFLWEGYLGRREFFGISAMPSMHVALPTLYVLAGFRASRWLGWIFVAYLLAILIGSVHLGWHYAIDGYVSIVAVWLIWVAVGRWQARNTAGGQAGGAAGSGAIGESRGMAGGKASGESGGKASGGSGGERLA